MISFTSMVWLYAAIAALVIADDAGADRQEKPGERGSQGFRSPH